MSKRKIKVGDEVKVTCQDTWASYDPETHTYVDKTEEYTRVGIVTDRDDDGFRLWVEGEEDELFFDADDEIEHTGRVGLVDDDLCDYTIVVHPDGYCQVGCQEIGSREMLRFWKKLGKLFGYEIEG